MCVGCSKVCHTNGALLALAAMLASRRARSSISDSNFPLVPLSTSRKCVWCGSRYGPKLFPHRRAARNCFNGISYVFAGSAVSGAAFFEFVASLLCTNAPLRICSDKPNSSLIFVHKFSKINSRLPVDESVPFGHLPPRRNADAHDRRALAFDVVVAHRFPYVLHDSRVVSACHYPCACDTNAKWQERQ